MKYWNKDKDVRQRCWTKVTLPRQHSMQPVAGGWVAKETRHVPDIKRWCQQQDSTGKFYVYQNGGDTWWFENEQDATLFLLKWS